MLDLDRFITAFDNGLRTLLAPAARFAAQLRLAGAAIARRR